MPSAYVQFEGFRIQVALRVPLRESVVGLVGLKKLGDRYVLDGQILSKYDSDKLRKAINIGHKPHKPHKFVGIESNGP
tara:strand:- start:104 stop:337 length:234 start_codon:yes stop_codon:yes gene_type:complete